MKTIKLITIICSIFVMMSLVACNGGGGGGTSSEGSLSLNLSDATTNDYKAVYVTIKEVRVCLDDENEGENSWYTVAEPERTYNLLELVNGVQAQLGVTDLDAGHYTQMRLIIGTNADEGKNILGEYHPFANYIIDQVDDCHELKIPSGIHTGIKLVSGFDIYENQTTELILDFDASRSVVKPGKSGKWLLKPTIKVRGTAVAISGTVISGAAGLEGVLVSAQVYDSINDEVVVQSSTITSEDGHYVLLVEPSAYNLVAYKEGYDYQCKCIVVDPNVVYGDENMVLTPASVGTLAGHVEVASAPIDTHVSISVIKSTQCELGIDTKIEVILLNIADGGDYSISLPVGSYHVVAGTEGYPNQEFDVGITDSGTTTQNISFGS